LSHNETEVTNTSIQNTQSDGGLNTFKEYFEDTYKFESTAKIIHINEDGHIVLDKTILHPQGGGQPHDKGSI